MPFDLKALTDKTLFRKEVLRLLDGGGTSSAPASATEATLQAIENLLKGDRAPTETIWTDNSNTYFLRVRTYNQETNLWEAPTYTLPSGADYTPIAGLRPASGTVDRELQESEYTARNTNTGYTAGDRITKTVVYDLSVATPTIAATFWVNVDTGVQLAAAPPQNDLLPATVAATSRIQVIYKLNNGTLKTGYVGQLAPNPTLYADLIGNTPVTIGLGPTEAIAASIEPARSVFLSPSQSFPIAHAGAMVDSFTQPAIGQQVAITATALETAAGSELQFGVGAEVFISDGTLVAGRYIVRGGSWPNISIELQNPALNELGSAQTAIASGASVAAMRMIALSRVTAPVGATHAKVSVTRSRAAIGSALTGVNSASLPIVEQAYQDKAQSDYPAVAMNGAPASLGGDEGPKEWIFDTIELPQDRLNFWLYAFADEGRTVHATIRWFGGVQ